MENEDLEWAKKNVLRQKRFYESDKLQAFSPHLSLGETLFLVLMMPLLLSFVFFFLVGLLVCGAFNRLRGWLR